MKSLFTILFSLLILTTTAQSGSNFHSFKVENIFGDSVQLSSFAGKKLLVVNTASFCGYTHQFTKLQLLDSIYQNQNFRVIGFPCNDFGGQDPYADSTINSFCQNQYGITFPMMSKVSIKTGDTSKVYKWLQKKSLNGVKNVAVDWNFNKFLIDEQGNWVRHFRSPVEPNDTAIINWILQTTTGMSIHNSVFENLRIKNPASGEVQFFGNINQESDLSYELIDLLGRKIAFGHIKNINDPITVGQKKGIFQFRLMAKDGFRDFRLLMK